MSSMGITRTAQVFQGRLHNHHSIKSKPKWFGDPDACYLGQVESNYNKIVQRVNPTPSPNSSLTKIFKDSKECVRIKAVP